MVPKHFPAMHSSIQGRTIAFFQPRLLAISDLTFGLGGGIRSGASELKVKKLISSNCKWRSSASPDARSPLGLLPRSIIAVTVCWGKMPSSSNSPYGSTTKREPLGFIASFSRKSRSVINDARPHKFDRSSFPPVASKTADLLPPPKHGDCNANSGEKRDC